MRPRQKKSGSFSSFDRREPTPGTDYPRDSVELKRMLSSRGGSHALLERVRWPHGFICPNCEGCSEPWRSGTGLLACRQCRQPVQLTRDSLLHTARLSVEDWLCVLWEMTARESAEEVGRRLCEKGWRPRLVRAQVAAVRDAMGMTLRRQLGGERGVVELGHTCFEVSAESAGKRWSKRAHVAIAVERGGHRSGVASVRVRHLQSDEHGELLEFATQAVETGSVVETIPRRGFAPLQRLGFVHTTCDNAVAADHVASVLELWMWGLGDVTLGGIQALLDEFAFRFNRRTMPAGRVFYDLVLAALLYRPANSDARRRVALG